MVLFLEFEMRDVVRSLHRGQFLPASAADVPENEDYDPADDHQQREEDPALVFS